ncbi:hypothetical protein [Nesterenkonia suensis]
MYRHAKKSAFSTIGLFACGALVAGHAVPAGASEVDRSVSSANVAESSSVDGASELVGANEGITEDVIERYDEFVDVTDSGEFVLKLPEGYDADAEEVRLVEASIAESNQVAAEQSVTERAAADELVIDQRAVTTSATSWGGHSIEWWGVQMWLNGSATANLNKLLGAGAGVSALTAAIMSWTGVGGAVAGVIAGAFAAGAGVANLCNWNDNGISIRKPHIGPVVCWPR